jgi:hypothetical protein
MQLPLWVLEPQYGGDAPATLSYRYSNETVKSQPSLCGQMGDIPHINSTSPVNSMQCIELAVSPRVAKEAGRRSRTGANQELRSNIRAVVPCLKRECEPAGGEVRQSQKPGSGWVIRVNPPGLIYLACSGTLVRAKNAILVALAHVRTMQAEPGQTT